MITEDKWDTMIFRNCIWISNEVYLSENKYNVTVIMDTTFIILYSFCMLFFVCALYVIELTLLCTVVKRRKQRKSTKRTSGKLVISYYA